MRNRNQFCEILKIKLQNILYIYVLAVLPYVCTVRLSSKQYTGGKNQEPYNLKKNILDNH